MKKILFFFLCYSIPLLAEEAACPSPPTTPWLSASEKWKSSEHTIEVGGQALPYMAHAGYLDVHDKEGKVLGKIFFVAYMKKGENASERPITFAFNGGPGASSVWLHMGALGPKRILREDEGQTRTAPYQWTTNEETILDLTDLVFIDPLGTGFSRTTKEDDKQFYEVRKDIESMGGFIRDFITLFDRWSSPKYIAGESYGTTRAAGLSQYLHEDLCIYLNGLVLVSVAIDFQTFVFSQGNFLPNALFVPTFSAAAWYHKKLPSYAKKSLQDVVKDAKAFAFLELLPALYQGNLLPEERQQKVLQKLSSFTGIDTNILQRYYPYLQEGDFMKELLANEKLYLGRMDARYTAPLTNLQRERPYSDPATNATDGIFTGALNAYLREELQLTEKYLPYDIINLQVNRDWNFTQYSLTTLSTMDALRWSMTINPDLRIFVGSGYYDLATPFAATEYTFLHLDLPTLKNQVSLHYYEGGHMYYLDPKNHQAFKQDLIQFYHPK